MIPVETIPEIGREGIKESGGGGEFKYEMLIHYKNLCKCHNVPPLGTKIKSKEKEPPPNPL
jgi:hypothetical protein